MKKRRTDAKLQKHCTKKHYVRLTRKKGKFVGITTGFILKKSTDFILLQETDDFRILGYQIIPVATIIDVRYNKVDKMCQYIIEQEGLLTEVQEKHKIDLTSWKSILNDVKETKLTVISECEQPKFEYFRIGKIKKINTKSFYIRNFDALGKVDKEETKLRFCNITKLSFDDRYANVFSRYLK